MKTKNVLTNLKTPIPVIMSQSHVVYQIKCPHCSMSYVGQTARHLATRIREHFSSGGKLKPHFDNCNIEPTNEMVKILVKAKGDKLLTLEALYISELVPKLNTKDEFRSRELK